MTRGEFRSLAEFAARRRDITTPWRERIRGVDYSVAFPENGRPSIVPMPTVVDVATEKRDVGDLLRSECLRAEQLGRDRRLIRQDAEQLPQRTGIASFSVAIARRLDITAAVVYRYLQAEQAQNIGDIQSFHEWRYWSTESAELIMTLSLPFLKSRQVVENAMIRLEAAKLIRTEATGKFLPQKHYTGRKRDIQTWCHARAPINYEEPGLEFDVVAARLHGMREAILTAHLENVQAASVVSGTTGNHYVKMVATEVEKVLPIGEKTIRSLLSKLKKRTVIAEDPDRSAHYRMANRRATVGMPEEEIVEYIAWHRWYTDDGPGGVARRASEQE